MLRPPPPQQRGSLWALGVNLLVQLRGWKTRMALPQRLGRTQASLRTPRDCRRSSDTYSYSFRGTCSDTWSDGIHVSGSQNGPLRRPHGLWSPRRSCGKGLGISISPPFGTIYCIPDRF